MKLNKGDKLYQGWSVSACDILRPEFSMYTIKKSAAGTTLTSSLFIIPVRDEDHKEAMQTLLEFYRLHPNTPGLLRVYDWNLEDHTEPGFFSVRCEQCSILSMMRFSEAQCYTVALDLLPALAAFRQECSQAEDLCEDNIYLTESGQFKLANFIHMTSSKGSWLRLDEDIAQLGELLSSLTPPNATVTSGFQEVCQRAKSFSYPSLESFETALKETRENMEHIQQKSRHRKMLKAVLSSMGLLCICAVFFAILSAFLPRHEEEVRYEQAYNNLARSLDSHEAILDEEKSALLEEKDWEYVDQEELYEKEITGARLRYAADEECSTFEIRVLDSYVSYNELIAALEGIAPDIVHHGFIEHEQFTSYLGLSSQMLEWLMSQGEQSRWEDGTRSSYSYSGNTIHVSYHEDDEKQASHYILSDYSRSVLLTTKYDSLQSPETYVFRFYSGTL